MRNAEAIHHLTSVNIDDARRKAAFTKVGLGMTLEACERADIIVSVLPPADAVRNAKNSEDFAVNAFASFYLL